MFNLFLKLLEKCGRKYAIVDFFGDVIQWRYYLFYVESHVDNRWLARLPNIFLHIYPGEKSGDGLSPEEANAHSHPYNTWGFIVKGGYTEVINEQTTRETTRFGVAYMSHSDHHRIARVKPGTVSLFLHGFRRAKWMSYTYVCKKVCDTCASTNGGTCHKTPSIKPLDNDIEDVRSKLGGRGWRTIKFIKVDDSFNATITNRKDAVAKMGIPKLDGVIEKREFMKKFMIKQIK